MSCQVKTSGQRQLRNRKTPIFFNCFIANRLSHCWSRCISRVQMKSWAGKALETVNCCAFLKRSLLTANLKFRKKIFLFFSFFACFTLKIEQRNDSYSRSKYLRALFAVPIKRKQMSFLSNGGKFKLYTLLNVLIFPTIHVNAKE
jgi:hypothetical protein